MIAEKLWAKWVERGHYLRLFLKQEKVPIYKRETPDCSPNSAFKLEMLAIPEVQEKLIEVISLMPSGSNSATPQVPHIWNAEKVRDDIARKLGGYGFGEFIARARDAVSRCRPHKGECVLMNAHSYVKMMEVVYTAYIIDIQPADTVMNLACGNTYWGNVWLANQCHKLYANDNGFCIPVHDRDRQILNYDGYQPGIHGKIEFTEFDASRKFPYPDNSFDKVVSHSSVEHIDNWETNVLPEIIRTLKPGGKCGLASAFHPLGREDLGAGQSSWWTKNKWERFVKRQDELSFKVIGNTDYSYGMPWRAEEDSDGYRFGGSVYIANFIFFQKTP